MNTDSQIYFAVQEELGSPDLSLSRVYVFFFTPSGKREGKKGITLRERERKKKEKEIKIEK